MLGVQTGWVDPYPMVISLFCVNCIYYLSYQWWGHLTLDPMSRKRTKTIYLYILFVSPANTCPSYANSCCLTENNPQSKPCNFTLPLPLGPNPRADEAHVRSDYNYLVVRRRLNYWRELWPFPSIIPKAAGERTHVNDKLAVNMTNKWTPQQLRLNFSDSFWLGTSGKEWWWVP